MLLLAQLGGYSLVHFIVMFIIIAAVIGVLFVVLRWMGVEIPPPIITIFWILVAACVGIVAIKFLLSLA